MRLLLSSFASFENRSPPLGMKAARRRRTGRALLVLMLLAAIGIRAQEDSLTLQATGRTRLRGAHALRSLSLSAKALLRGLRQMICLRARAQSGLPVRPRGGSLAAAWQPLGPAAIASANYGSVTGRVTSIAVDPNDAIGNTVYVGTTGGGVWKSTNAAGPLAGVSLEAAHRRAAGVRCQSRKQCIFLRLSIGAVTVQPASNGVILAGTGDPNDATDSYYGEGILRSADGGLDVDPGADVA